MYLGLAPKSNGRIVNKIIVPMNQHQVTTNGEVTNDTITYTEPIINVDRYENTRVMYEDPMIKSSDLCSVVQNYQSLCRSVTSSVTKWTRKLRNNEQRIIKSYHKY